MGGENLNKNIQESILAAVDVLISKRLKNISVTYYFTGKLTAVNSSLCTLVNGSNTYTGVRYRYGIAPVAGDIVKVCVPNGDLSQKFIDEDYTHPGTAGGGGGSSDNLASVALSGSYTDLVDTPTLPVVPTNVSAFTNDAGYLTQSDISETLSASGDGSDMTVAFTQNVSRINIATGEKLSVIFGKISKWFSDLKTVAFTGSYTDLTNQPSIPTVPSSMKNPCVLKFGDKTYDGSTIQEITAEDVGATGGGGGTVYWNYDESIIMWG